MNERKYVLVVSIHYGPNMGPGTDMLSRLTNANTVLISLCYSQGASGTGSDVARPTCPGSGKEICIKVTMIPKIVVAFILP